jgi:nucleoside-diphosphate kinase
LGVVRVRADDVLGNGNPIFRQAIAVERARGVPVALLCVRGTVTFHGTLAFILVSLFRRAWLNTHRNLLYNLPILMERTFAIIKPDATSKRYTGKILQRIEEAGFTIRAMKTLHLSRKEAEGFYAVHRERPFFKGLTEFMASGPIVALVLEAPDAIKKWRTLMGATDPAKADAGTIRKEFASSIGENATHGSDAPETAAFEIGYFFAGMELVD